MWCVSTRSEENKARRDIKEEVERHSHMIWLWSSDVYTEIKYLPCWAAFFLYSAIVKCILPLSTYCNRNVWVVPLCINIIQFIISKTQRCEFALSLRKKNFKMSSTEVSNVLNTLWPLKLTWVDFEFRDAHEQRGTNVGNLWHKGDMFEYHVDKI